MTPGRGHQGDLQFADTRHAAIMNTLRTCGQVKAVQIAEDLGVTHETIRKDLLALESRRQLKRVLGGALPIESISFEPGVSPRTTMAVEKPATSADGARAWATSEQPVGIA